MLDEVVATYKKIVRAGCGATRAQSASRVRRREEQSTSWVAGDSATGEYLALPPRLKKIPSEQIAIYTQTKDVPEESEKVVSLTALQPRHRHIIFNQALQEGWDDPEAYLCYFDEQTKSYVRIQQIVGRVLRDAGGAARN